MRVWHLTALVAIGHAASSLTHGGDLPTALATLGAGIGALTWVYREATRERAREGRSR